MRFLIVFVDALVAFVRRNPLTVLALAVLALVAPSLFRGLAAFVLYIFLGTVLLCVLLALLFRWRLYRLRRDMEGQFRGFGEGGDPFSGAGDPFARRRSAREGEVKVHRTADAPDKRVASDVGDYVEFEETKEK